jgi:hypothetical protein
LALPLFLKYGLGIAKEAFKNMYEGTHPDVSLLRIAFASIIGSLCNGGCSRGNCFAPMIHAPHFHGVPGVVRNCDADFDLRNLQKSRNELKSICKKKNS